MLNGSALEEAKNEFTALHEGKTPRGAVVETILEATKVRYVLGQCTEIQYWKDVTDGEYRYHHPFAAHAQPTIFVDDRGKLGIYRGRYVVTYRGIEDRSRSSVEKERLPRKASKLITLGRLEFVRYRWTDDNGVERVGEVRFSRQNAPVIAHDQYGDLHVLRGRYNLRNEAMKNGAYGMKTKKRRSNPAGGMDFNERAKRTLMTGAAVGVGATATVLIMNKAMARMNYSPNVKAGLQIALGVAGGIGLGYLVPSMPSLAAAWTVGGVVSGSTILYATHIAPRLASGSTPASRPNPTTPGQTTPAAFPYLPGPQMPAGYAAYQGAACGV